MEQNFMVARVSGVSGAENLQGKLAEIGAEGWHTVLISPITRVFKLANKPRYLSDDFVLVSEKTADKYTCQCRYIEWGRDTQKAREIVNEELKNQNLSGFSLVAVHPVNESSTDEFRPGRGTDGLFFLFEKKL